MTSVAGSEKTEVVYGTSNVLNAEIQFFSNARLKVDTCMDYTRPSLTLGIESIRKSLLDAKGRGVKLRYITEITTENISYCKELMKIADVRHLDGIKGNFMVSEKEYLAPAASNDTSNIASQIIYSNLHVIVEHEQYIFETLWTKAIPAEQRIREIEDGVQPASTRILKDQDQIINELRRFNNRATKLSICSAFGGMQMTYKYLFDTFLGIVEKYKKGEGEGMRWIINIDKDNLDLVKVFLKSGIQIGHITNMPPMNFGVSDVQMAATIEKMEGGKISRSFLISTEPFYIEHFNSLFDKIWKNGIDAKVRIKAIEEGVDSEGIEIIQDPVEVQKLGFRLIQTALKEILVVYSTANAFHRQEHAGSIRLLLEAATKRGVKVRILTPEDELILEIARKLNMVQEARQPHEKISIRHIQPHSQTKVSILIVDKKYSLAIELKDDTKQTSVEAIGLATYSNSQSTVLSYVSIFESLWTQTELYQKLKESEKIKDDFVNIAAHELRTPVQPILGLADILRSRKTDGEEEAQYLDVIMRNAKRLKTLTENILDISRIESKSLDLKKESFNLSDMILNVINDSNNLVTEMHKDTNLKLEFIDPKEEIFITADKGRINQVISNLLSNAIKFTNEGTVSVSVAAVTTTNEISVSISDTGAGIDSEILPRLFTKFATKSTTGTGLGLFISKSIIEAHNGKIWGKNNPRKGATFGFSLPLQSGL